MRILERAMAKRRAGDDELRGRHRCQRLVRVVAIELDLGVPQQVSLARLLQHGARVHAADLLERNSARHIPANAVGGLTEEAERCLEQLRQHAGEPMQYAGLRMMLSKVAEEDGRARTRYQTFGDLRGRPARCTILE